MTKYAENYADMCVGTESLAVIIFSRGIFDGHWQTIREIILFDDAEEMEEWIKYNNGKQFIAFEIKPVKYEVNVKVYNER